MKFAEQSLPALMHMTDVINLYVSL